MYLREIDPETQASHGSSQAGEAASTTVTESPCLHFLSKGMFVTGRVVPDHERDGSGDGYCWCNLTQRVLGPDQEFVDRKLCRATRECYKARV